MGIVICKKHGRSSPVETSPHVAEEIDKKIYGRWYRVVSYLLVCDVCLHRYGLEPFEDSSSSFDDFLDPEERLEAFVKAYDQLQGRTVRCSQCVAVAKVEQARRNGELDPFPIYERTVNSNFRDEIAGLQQHLLANFQF